MMTFKQDSKFDKEFKKLVKKYKNLTTDLKTFKQLHQRLYDTDVDQNFVLNFFNSNKATILYQNQNLKIVKARLDSRDFKGGLRIIYCSNLKQKTITLIEIYAKNVKSREDAKRWRNYM